MTVVQGEQKKKILFTVKIKDYFRLVSVPF